MTSPRARRTICARAAFSSPCGASTLAAALGYLLLAGADPSVVAVIQSFAAGAILTMLADTMFPEAYQHGGKLVGVVTTLGFAVAFTIHLLD